MTITQRDLLLLKLFQTIKNNGATYVNRYECYRIGEGLVTEYLDMDYKITLIDIRNIEEL